MSTKKRFFTDESLERFVESIRTADNTTLESSKTESTAKDIVILSAAQKYTDDKIEDKPGYTTGKLKYTDIEGNEIDCVDGVVLGGSSPDTVHTIGPDGLPSATLAINGGLAFGYKSLAKGIGAISLGYETIAEQSSSGGSTVALGLNTTARGSGAFTTGVHTNANGIQQVFGKYNTEKAGTTSTNVQDSTHTDAIFIVGCGTSTASKNAFRISSGGKCFGSTAFEATGADFAELFEWQDGNPDNEDRRGLFVTLDGDKIKPANAGDDYIGVISGAQAFIGNSASEEWQGKYLTDIFGTKLYHEIDVPAEVDEKTGEIITPAHRATQYVVNPDYDPNQEYIMRENRKEWGIVGLLGQITVIDDGTCVVGGYVQPSLDGVGTAAASGYRVMKRLDENHIKVLVK